MTENYVKTNNNINSKNSILIYNILRALGLSPALKGTKLLNKAIQMVINNDNEFVVFEDIYKKISSNYITFNNAQIRNTIKYAIDTRNEQKSVVNFEKIFGYKYDKYYFTNKTIIEEIARVIKYKNNN